MTQKADQLTLHEFIFSALMHDIGKVMQRAECSRSSTFNDRAVSHKNYDSHFHACWTEEFLNLYPCKLISKEKWQRIINLASSHHLDTVALEDDQNFLILLKAADHLASSFDRDVKLSQNYKAVPLYSVFQEIRLHSDEKIKYDKAYSFKPLKAENIFPETAKIESRVIDYKKLYNAFTEDYQFLSQEWKYEEEFIHFVNSVDYLMEKYFYCVPGNTQEEHPCNSLYHHSKTTALIASVLYQKYHSFEGKLSLNEVKESGDYLLIGGDLSGIQNYLYDLNPENSQKGAKFLRARSFKVKALSDMVIFKIINQCHLSQQNIVINAGGKFILLAPKTDDIIKQLQVIQHETDELFYHEFLASISLNLDWSLTIKLNELHQDQFKNTLERFFDALEVKKQSRFKSLLLTQTENSVQKWDPKAFIVNQEKLVNDQICHYCNKRLKHDDDKCPVCNQEIKLGESLPKNQFVVIAKTAFSDKELIRFGDTALFLINSSMLNTLKDKLIKANDSFYIYSYKKAVDNRSLAFPYKATAAYVPTDDDHAIIDLETLSKESSIKWNNNKESGLCANAVIKGDVDNLGTIFQKGLLLENDKLSLARYISCSSLIDFFFSEYIPYLLENDSSEFNGVDIPFNTIYTVYAGGDDFCLIGPWLTILLFAQRLKQDFSQFTCDNPEIHFSCGIELLHGKSPVKHFIEKTDQALEIAKKEKDLHYRKVVKNCVFLFDTLIPWDEYEEMLNQAETYFEFLNHPETKGFTTQFIYRLFKYHQSYINSKYPQNPNKVNIRDYMVSAQLTYDLKRNFKTTEPAYQSMVSLIQTDNKKMNIDRFRIMKAILHIVIYANRANNKGGNYESIQ